MEWSNFVQEIVIACVGFLVTCVFSVISYFLSKNTSTNKQALIIEKLNSIVKSAVLNVYQTYVQALKESGSFNDAEKEVALNKCLSIIYENLTKDVEKYLNKNYDDVESYLITLIEGTLGELKSSLALNKEEEDNVEITSGDNSGSASITING